MSRKKVMCGIFILLVAILSNVMIFQYQNSVEDEQIQLNITVQGNHTFESQLYYMETGEAFQNGFDPSKMISKFYDGSGKETTYRFYLPADVSYIRFDPTTELLNLSVKDISISASGKKIEGGSLRIEDAIEQNMIGALEEHDGAYELSTTDTDSYFIWNVENIGILDQVANIVQAQNTILKLLACLVIDLLLFFGWKDSQVLFEIPKEVVGNRKLIFNLSKNDFKTKFAGSYFGIIWAFVQPIVTVLVYWFVFEKALNAGTQSTKAGITVPYVLWLIAGLVPWFYFSEVLSGGTNALLEYNYLVKKVVFKISTLPVVKVISSLFVHLFFVAFTLILYSCYHYYPTLYTIQLIYYSFCMMVLCAGLVYATSAMVAFFRDLSQVIAIILQVGMWMTPIMWNMDGMKLPKILIMILQMNPMYYIVSGYRDSLINQVWFWERPGLTLYFWLFTGIVLAVGTMIFRKLQAHFADVL